MFHRLPCHWHGIAVVVIVLPTLGCSSKGVQPDFTTTAEALMAEYQKDPQAARDKYDGKLIELQGEVSGIGRGPMSRVFEDMKLAPALMLGPRGQVPRVLCFTTDDQPWAKVAPPQSITIRGRGDADSGRDGPVLLDCQIVAAGPCAAVPITAAALAQECAASEEQTAARYRGKCLRINGELLKIELRGSAGFVGHEIFSLHLEGDDKRIIVCRGADDLRRLKALKPGQQVQLMGEFGHGERSEVVVLDCVLVDRPN